MKLFFLVLTSLILFTFNIKAQPTYQTEVAYLADNRDKGYFLISAYQLHQEVEHFEDSVMLASGFRSQAHLAAIDSLNFVDSLLAGKINEYLDLYGHPRKKDFTEIPRITPWTIMSHAKNKEQRLKYFTKFHNAYLEGDLERRRFLAFLEKEYEHSFHKNFQSYSRGEQRVEELLQELDLLPVKSFKLRFPD